MDAPFADYTACYPDAPLEPSAAHLSPATVFHAMRDFALRVSWKRELLEDLETLFWARPTRRFARRWSHQQVLRPGVCRPAHAAGDGNVHTTSR